MAGALGVQLGGTNHYGGVAVERPVIGQAGGRRLGGDVITDAVRIMWLAYALAVIMVFHAGV
jgi:cobalamin biosynthesis protein CobD/CbiB